MRLAVQDVRARGQELDKKRKQQGKAYTAVKSKIAGNMKVIDRTNKELGYNLNRYQPKKTIGQSVAKQSLSNFMGRQSASPNVSRTQHLRSSLSGKNNLIDLRKSQMQSKRMQEPDFGYNQNSMYDPNVPDPDELTQF